MPRRCLRTAVFGVLLAAVLSNAGCGPLKSSSPGSDVKFTGDLVGETAVVGGSTGFQGVKGTIGTQQCRAYPAGQGFADTVNYPATPANYQADLRAVIASEVYYLNIWVMPFVQAGSFPIQKPDQAFGSSPAGAIATLSDYGGSLSPLTSPTHEWRALSGTVTVNRDERAGSLDVEFGVSFNGIRPASPTLGPRSLRVAGTWSCDK